MLVFNVTDQVRETIQQTLYTLLMQRESRLPLTRDGRLSRAASRSVWSSVSPDAAHHAVDGVPSTTGRRRPGTSSTSVGTSPVSSLVTSSTVPVTSTVGRLDRLAVPVDAAVGGASVPPPVPPPVGVRRSPSGPPATCVSSSGTDDAADVLAGDRRRDGRLTGAAAGRRSTAVEELSTRADVRHPAPRR